MLSATLQLTISHYERRPEYLWPMVKKVLAKVKPALLVWARESAGLSEVDAADKAGVKLEALQDWEAGRSAEIAPSIPQLRKLAAAYKRPLAVLYLQEPPVTFQALKDFRRLPGGGTPRMPPEVVLEARISRERRESVLALATDAGAKIGQFELQATLTEDPEEVGQRVRDWLGVRLPLDSSTRDGTGHKALKYWRAAVERKDVLVLQTSRFSSEIASGFAIYERLLPIVVISRKDAPPRRRLFSLLHELTHLILRASGVSDLSLDTDLSQAPEEQRVEVFCNAVAAATLVPASLLLEHSVILQHGDAQSWSDDELARISRDFGASREAILRRLVTFNLTSKKFYEDTRERYIEEWHRQRERDKNNSKDGIPRNMANEAFGDLGRRYIGLVLDQFYHERLTLSDVAGYLGVKTKHIPVIEQMIRKSA
jgi:Zn-dependent peptidase ImmA (M78 family)